MAANVLIVDDSATMRRMIARTIEISGLDVAKIYEAANGIEALAQMDQYEIAAVLLDINMPVMSGVQLIERLRDDQRLRNIPVIIASTEGSQVRIDHLLQAGARGFIRKPFQPEQIRDALAPLLGLKQQPTQTTAATDDLSF